MPFLFHLRQNYSSSPQVSHSNYARDYFYALFHIVVIEVKYYHCYQMNDNLIIFQTNRHLIRFGVLPLQY